MGPAEERPERKFAQRWQAETDAFVNKLVIPMIEAFLPSRGRIRVSPISRNGEPGLPASELRVPRRIADNAILAKLWAYWLAKRGNRAMPCHDDILPFEIPRLLPHLILLERTNEGRFRYRLMGTAVVAAHGFDGTHKLIDEVFSEPRRGIASRHCALAFERALPMFTPTNYASPAGVDYQTSVLLLPISDRRGRMRMILIGNTFAADPGFRGSFPGETLSPDREVVEFFDHDRP